ncbi:MAG: hypothetical protein KDA47_25040 [Planctomycetales bacterium]|nr:hypothetical protein [Planctomycetales bacterium]
MWCRDYPSFGELAHIGKGFDFVGQDNLPSDAVTFSVRRLRDGVPGFVNFDRGLQVHQLPKRVWINLDPKVIPTPRTGTTTKVPQILWNYARAKRSPWRLKGLLDREGHAVTSRFLTVRPNNDIVPLELLWALANSPIANAFAHSHSMKRDNLTGMMRSIPVPIVWETDAAATVQAVKAYLSAVTPEMEKLSPSPDPQQLCRLLLQVDAEVLKLYDLPPRLERQLLDYFRGHERQGVPFFFDRYYPADYEPCFPLHEYLSDAYEQSTAGSMRDRHESATPEMAAAMEAAVDAFPE